MADPAPMPVWAVTGPIGGGKSAAVAVLAGCGAAVIDADAEGHALLREPAVIASLRREFGDGVAPAGEIDRRALGALVFDDPAALARLNALVHPALSRRIAARLAETAASEPRPSLAVVEAAVYFLLPSFGDVDLVICVTAADEVRRDRLTSSGRLDAAAATARIAAQRPMLRDWERSDIVLRNDGGLADLERAVRHLYLDRIREKETP